MKNVLVLCTGNSCRSQMAHGFLKTFTADNVAIYSAGVETHGINKNAVKFMMEEGIDISNHTSNHIDDYQAIEFDFVFTVCDHAKEVCPYFPTNAKLIHHNFSDPSKVDGSEQEIATAFRSVRNEIKEYFLSFLKEENILKI